MERNRSEGLELRTFAAAAVGNTRTRFALCEQGAVDSPVSLPNTEMPEIVSRIATLLEAHHDAPVLIAGVNPKAVRELSEALDRGHGIVSLLIGKDVRIPIHHALDDASTVGQDRLLCALGAYAKAEQACIVIDAGTAITVDFVDGEGVFQGGMIAPGLAMMLRSLHEGTAALPSLSFADPDPARGVLGKDTAHAMMLGVKVAAQGFVRYATERLSDMYGAYPQIIATGGDAPVLFENDGVVENVVPDLQLIGIIECARRSITGDAEPGLIERETDEGGFDGGGDGGGE